MLSVAKTSSTEKILTKFYLFKKSFLYNYLRLLIKLITNAVASVLFPISLARLRVFGAEP